MREIEEVALALASPSRLALLGLLAKGEFCVTQIADQLGVAQSTASYHVAVLESAGLVIVNHVGQRHVVRRRWPKIEIAFDRG